MDQNDLNLFPDQSLAFRAFLKRGGRSAAAIERVFKVLSEYQIFLTEIGKNVDAAGADDLLDFVDEIESAPKSSAKTQLWALRYYYEFTGNDELFALTGELRQQRIERTPFALKDFRGANPDHAQRLAEAGVININHMLKRGATPEARQRLASQTGVPVESILEFVKLSDLARIQGIKGVRARLYVDAGIDSIEKLAKMDPDSLRALVIDFIERTGFEGIATLPKEARSAVRKARSLPKIITW